MARSRKEYALRVALRGQRVSRTISLLGHHSLRDLHEAVFPAFDRYDEHLYAFYFPLNPRARRFSSRQAQEFTVPSLVRPRGRLGDPSQLNAARTTLDRLDLHVGLRFQYLFDFGDQWWHDIEVVAVRVADPAGSTLIVERRGRSPAQYPGADRE